MKNILIHIKLIWQGWTNYFLDLVSDIKYKKYFDERYRICQSCIHNANGICKLCSCVLKAKTKAEDAECPVHKWFTIPETLLKEK